MGSSRQCSHAIAVLGGRVCPRCCRRNLVVTDQAFVTLATNDVYCQGALVLCQSLRNHKTTRRIVALFTPQVSSNMRRVLERLFDEVVEVNVLDSGDSAHLALLTRPELGVTFTKIHCWCLIQYSKCVFMDADTLVCSNIDDLFEREELSAAPDPGWPDCFNTGVFVYRPSIETYNQLLQFAAEKGSFDGGDQGLLNSFFSGWSTKDIHKHLPFIYNLSGIAIYSYLPAFKQFGSTVKVVHFLGPTKPWHHKYSAETKSVIQENMSPSDSMFINFLNSWWDIYTTCILPLLADHKVEEKSVDYQMVGMRRQEEAATAERHIVATKTPEPQKPVIGRRHGFFYIPQPQPIATTIPKVFIQLPHLGPLVHPHAAKAVRFLNLPLAAEPSTSSMKMQAFARRSTAHVRQLNVPFIAKPRKSALKTVHRKEKIALVPSMSTKQHSFARKPTANVRQQSVSFDAEPSTSSVEMVHNEEMISPVASELTKQEDIAASLADLSLEVVPEQPIPAEERRRWEEGNVDYLGRDAFVNIQRKLDRFLK
ncbi:glycogenin-2 isoform X4 [Heterodontus francisci]|uniref:glycogenin-2 isoform X4 n=1 Tax=Heterodontus francisci TaxID=7792 RepID=UPI00355C3BE1